MADKIKILDESGDKKYFSQLPHYILNHSTANDQSLYWQMKRYSGENGKCFATQETIMKKMGIGRKAYNKSLEYLLTKGWIRFIGTTKSKTHPIKTYSITDIWKLNITHYEEIQAERTVSFNTEIQAESEKIQARSTVRYRPKDIVEEELYKEEPYKEPFVFLEVLKKMFTGNNQDKLMAYYFQEKQSNFDNYEQYQLVYKMNVRDVVNLVKAKYTDDQIINAFEYCKKKYKDINWNLHTIIISIAEANK